MTTRFRIWLQATDGTQSRWVMGSYKTRKSAQAACDGLTHRTGQLVNVLSPGVYTVIETLNGQPL
jgi:hypothetical protein